MADELQTIKMNTAKLVGEQVIKTENFIVVGLIALGALLIIKDNAQAVTLTSNIVSGLLGYMGRTALAR